jgi:hypothetical protein
MHRTRWIVAAVLGCALAGPGLLAASSKEAPRAQTFGAPITLEKSTSLGKVQKNPARFVGKTLRIEGVVKDVCQGMGCWVEVEDAKGARFIARSLDESVLLPTDCKGSRIVVQGSMAEMRKKGHDHAAHKALEAGHSCPAPDYLLSTTGIELIATR